MFRKLLFFSAIALATCSSVRADDQVLSAQQALKSQGFYTGAADGELSAETKAGIKRFQIHSGLDATGELNQPTLDALRADGASNSASPADPAPAAPVQPEPAPSVAQAAPPDLRATPPANIPSQPQPGFAHPQPPSPQPDPAYATLYARTPYEIAPAAVQRDTLRRARAILRKDGFYHGELDAEPGPATEEALSRFQRSHRLPKSGQLDIDTLAAMHLLPVTRSTRHMKPTRDEERPHAAVREPFIPRGRELRDEPVRGVPVD